MDNLPFNRTPIIKYGTGINKTVDSFGNIDTENEYNNIENNKLFCFNGNFTILTIFILILLLIFIHNSK